MAGGGVGFLSGVFGSVAGVSYQVFSWIGICATWAQWLTLTFSLEATGPKSSDSTDDLS